MFESIYNLILEWLGSTGVDLFDSTLVYISFIVSLILCLCVLIAPVYLVYYIIKLFARH